MFIKEQGVIPVEELSREVMIDGLVKRSVGVTPEARKDFFDKYCDSDLREFIAGCRGDILREASQKPRKGGERAICIGLGGHVTRFNE